MIQPPTPERVKYDIFDRVNRGGTRLNNQEMRNALYGGKVTKLLKELSESDAFLKATERGVSSTRMKDQYIILRTLAFLLWLNGDLKVINFAVEQNNDEEWRYLFVEAAINIPYHQ
jgi:hypothetical protein